MDIFVQWWMLWTWLIIAVCSVLGVLGVFSMKRRADTWEADMARVWARQEEEARRKLDALYPKPPGAKGIGKR